ncbi:hypothetical protein GGS20DRAFT_152208 [Poronia punctata]|nr:hypothetical protein GGS20DRAFT_152208 [Poronia punctata]
MPRKRILLKYFAFLSVCRQGTSKVEASRLSLSCHAVTRNSSTVCLWRLSGASDGASGPVPFHSLLFRTQYILDLPT